MSDFVICINNDSNAADQIRSIDKQRLVRRLGTLKTETMDRVDRASKISMGLIKILVVFMSLSPQGHTG
jgi:hypothetical protein